MTIHRTRAPAPVAPRPAATTSNTSRAPAREAPRPDRFERGPTTRSAAELIRTATTVRRSDGPEGFERVLTPHESARARRALAAHPELLGLSAGLSDVRAAVLTRAIAARADTLTTSLAVALAELRELAAALAGIDDATARQRATSLDLDSTRNDSTVDPLAWWERSGTIHDRRGNAAAADNDGLYQRFTASCGTTVIQMMLAEVDPAYAFHLHAHDLHADDVTGPIADFQRTLLEDGGGIALGRREALLRARLRNALGRLGATGRVGAADKEALLAHALRGAPLRAGGRRALEACREQFAGFPTVAELARLRRAPLPNKDEGLGAAVFIRALESVVTPRNGIRYRATSPEEGFARGQAYRHLDVVEAALRQGRDVPFGIAEPAHWMLLSAVKGREPDRQFLVSDPDAGRTAWVRERDLLSGSFARDAFALPKPKERPYVDMFILPTAREE